MWNEKYIFDKCLSLYNYICHPLINQILIYKDQEFKINNVFKEWKSGWYISLELENPNLKQYYIRIPFENINTEDKEILEKIKIINQYGKIKT